MIKNTLKNSYKDISTIMKTCNIPETAGLKILTFSNFASHQGIREVKSLGPLVSYAVSIFCS